MTDPEVRADESCAQCRGKRLTKIPSMLTQRSKAELLVHLTADPFCASTCARKWHRCELDKAA